MCSRDAGRRLARRPRTLTLGTYGHMHPSMSEPADLALSLADRIGHGAFGDIFAPASGQQAIKVFRRLNDCMMGHVAPHVFRAETDALRIASAHPILSRHTPKYHGELKIRRVENEAGEDISKEYWLELAYAMERIAPDPEERKVGSFYSPDEWHLMKSLVDIFEAAGIKHVGDASALHWQTGHPVIIDFGCSDAAADHARLD